ncbi:MAG: hypothetical protein JWM39_737 [Parcubacteria group bacterium]|nr:hypothetical protein [Parcubacteria group bacterium]
MNELTIDGKMYISSKKAADLTGYAKDYVGQLCREGHVEARMVGRSWYVLESSIRAHRFGGDPHAEPVEAPVQAEPLTTPMDTWEKPTYVPEMAPSMPIPTVQRPPEVMPEPAPTVPDENILSTAETLTDMQAAWKEWFAQKQDTLIETPEIIDAREEVHEREEEVALNIQAFKDAHQDIEESHHAEMALEEKEEPVSILPIHPITEEVAQYEEVEEESEPVVIHHVAEVQRSAPVEEPILSRKQRKQAQIQARRARVSRARRSGGAGSFVLQALLVVVILVSIVVTAIGTGYAARFATANPFLLPVFDYLGGTSTYSK